MQTRISKPLKMLSALDMRDGYLWSSTTILKAHALAAAESEEERTIMDEHWLFEDFDEDEYL